MSWAPAYASPAELASWLRVDADDTELGLAVEAASRAVDKACGRQFGSEPATRFFTADCHRGTWYASLDDLAEVDTVECYLGGAYQAVADYDLTPLNPKGKPYTGIESRQALTGRLRISGTWGWLEVPDAIKLAVLIQAGRLYQRRENVDGPLSSQQVDDVRYSWSSGATADLDADVLSSVSGYVRHWFVA